MKIRLLENNLNVRLEPEDLTLLESNGIIQTHLEFPNRTLFAYLEVLEMPDIQVDFTEEGIQIYLPEEELADLINTRRVGFTSEHGKITVTIEKNLPKRRK